MSRNPVAPAQEIPEEEVIPPGPLVLREATGGTPNTANSISGQTNETGVGISARSEPGHVEVATGLLGFLALFNNGRSTRYREYMGRYQKYLAAQAAKT